VEEQKGYTSSSLKKLKRDAAYLVTEILTQSRNKRTNISASNEFK
jgi:hypothetical protein